MARRNPHPRDLPPLSREARERALHALSLMRTQGLSLTAATQEAGTTLATAKKYVGTALRKEGERYQASEWDRIVRPMKFITPRGLIALDVKDSRSASRLGRYMVAVDEYLKTGDAEVLRPFGGKTIVVDKVARSFVVDPETLETLANIGEVQFEDLYANLQNRRSNDVGRYPEGGGSSLKKGARVR